MLGNFFNTLIHPVATSSIVDWSLWRWSMDEQARLTVIIPDGEAEEFNNRYRVALAKMRKVLRDNDLEFKQFGVSLASSKWTMIHPNGSVITADAIYLGRFVQKHHIMTEVFRHMDFGFPGRKIIR